MTDKIDLIELNIIELVLLSRSRRTQSDIKAIEEVLFSLYLLLNPPQKVQSKKKTITLDEYNYDTVLTVWPTMMDERWRVDTTLPAPFLDPYQTFLEFDHEIQNSNPFVDYIFYDIRFSIMAGGQILSYF